MSEYVVAYRGRKLANAEADRLEARGSRYMFEVNSRWTINGATRKNIARYFNHSCRPNADPMIRDKRVRIKTIKNIKTEGKPTQDTVAGMAHYGETGTGVVEGATIVWSVDVLGAKKPLIILTFAAPNLYEKNSAGYESLLGSIKKI